jgi:hypothetical protein
MGALAKFVKDPDETKRYVVSYVDWLATGELLESVVFEVNVDSGPDNATLPVVESNALSTDLIAVVFFVSGGAAGAVYKITLRVNTNGGQIKEDAILISVRNT